MIDGDVSSGLSKTGALSRSNPLDVNGELVSAIKLLQRYGKVGPLPIAGAALANTAARVITKLRR
jgi:hypothetical protein